MANNFNHGYLDYPIYAFSKNYQHGHVEEWHQHDRIQLIHTLTGVLRVETDAGIWICPPGRGVWIPALQPHALHIHGDVKARGIFIEHLSRANFMNICRVVNISPLLKELINTALCIHDKIQPHGRDERVFELILDELQWLETLPFQLPEAQSPAMIQLCHAVRQSLSDTWTLEDVAKTMHMSSKTFTRQFQKETAMSFAQWIRQAKLIQAMVELCNYKPILQIALDLGYESPSAFSAMFKRETGMTPSEYLIQFQSSESASP